MDIRKVARYIQNELGMNHLYIKFKEIKPAPNSGPLSVNMKPIPGNKRLITIKYDPNLNMMDKNNSQIINTRFEGFIELCGIEDNHYSRLVLALTHEFGHIYNYMKSDEMGISRVYGLLKRNAIDIIRIAFNREEYFRLINDYNFNSLYTLTFEELSADNFAFRNFKRVYDMLLREGLV